MSLPPHVQWVYDHHPEKEAKKITESARRMVRGYLAQEV
jgi:coproporphyrinogen III oxidase